MADTTLSLSTPTPAAAPPVDSALSVRDFQVGYGSYVLMRHVSFEVRKGDIFFIMGGSGSGKSTLLHVLMGLKPPQAGKEFFGKVDFWGARRPSGAQPCATRASSSRAAPSGAP